MSIIAKNRQAYYDNKILEEYQCGIVLTGGEVRSIIEGGVNLTGSFVMISTDIEAFVINMNISKWKFDTDKEYDPTKKRKLLLNKKEIIRLNLQKKQEQAVIIPLYFFKSHNKLKLNIALAKPLKKFDKRKRDKERTEKRNLVKELAN